MIEPINMIDMIPMPSIQNKQYTMDDSVFKISFDAAKDLLVATNEAEQITTQLTYDFMTGKNDNIHDLMIAQEKSSLMLNFTMQVRNKLMEAYDEIMQIPV
ncbi:MAG: hypothetical protein ATN35_08955 [Epulopiscium sp. Nele67-Bin004]|nr:MAG: hypothetical protein ATN35_08955 [Epulopiscium sp. Nele67-Bin004]